MILHEILPVEEIRNRFECEVKCVQAGPDEFPSVFRLQQSVVSGTVFNGWNRILNCGKHPFDPQALRQHIEIHPSDGPVVKKSFIKGIELLTGEPFFNDFSLSICEVQDKKLKMRKCCQLFVAHTYPNVLHIGDVFFADPYRRIDSWDRKYEMTSYKGLGLLGAVMERTEAYAREKQIDWLTLTAASEDLIPLFSKYGFRVESNEFGRCARAMEKPISDR